ncbi:MAG: hypothetical protein PHQ98_01405 [Candidatus ainarchaeum sp.]|nr:hypothetical protein [Candidatus ainarchaeum sp.]
MIIQLIEQIILYAFEWLIIFLINLVPAFAPPTWATLSYLYINFEQNLIVLAIIGVTASTAGRYALAKLSGLFSKKIHSEEKKKELDVLKEKLEGKNNEKFWFTFFFSLSPLPSNALFIALGSIKTDIKPALAGFFIGRLINYTIMILIVTHTLSWLLPLLPEQNEYFTIGLELLSVIVIILFFKINWLKYINIETEKKKKWEYNQKIRNSKKIFK